MLEYIILISCIICINMFSVFIYYGIRWLRDEPATSPVTPPPSPFKRNNKLF